MRYKNLDSHPWTVFIDENKYYWIEEYPWIEYTQALNGFIYAIYGLYEYYLLTNDFYCKVLLQAAITTIRHNIQKYRIENAISYYCLRHKGQIATYHMFHIEQLQMLYKITGDTFFRETADLFYNDYHLSANPEIQ